MRRRSVTIFYRGGLVVELLLRRSLLSIIKLLLWGRLLIGEALWGNLLAVGRIVVVRLLWWIIVALLLVLGLGRRPVASAVVCWIV